MRRKGGRSALQLREACGTAAATCKAKFSDPTEVLYSPIKQGIIEGLFEIQMIKKSTKTSKR